MLKSLDIEQFVIIDKLHLDFNTGLTVLTGETGAGKSILLDAVGLLWGDEANTESVRHGQEKAVVEGVFQIPEKNPVWEVLAGHGIPFDKAKGTINIKRVTPRAGTGEASVNSILVDTDILKRIGRILGEIHGQFANQSLLGSENQLNLLDLSADFPKELLTNVAAALKHFKEITAALEDENTFLARHAHELRQTDELVGKFERLGMRQNFYEDCVAEHARLVIAKETGEAFQAILSQLIAGNGALKALKAANDILARTQNLEREKMVNLAEFLAVASQNTSDAVDEMERLAPEYDIDIKPINHYAEIIKTLEEIAEKAELTTDKLFDYYQEMSAKLKRIRGGREKIAELTEELTKARNAYIHHSHILSDARVIAGQKLGKAITQELPPLKLMKAEFAVDVVERQDIPWTEKGLNVVTFMAKMNQGSPMSPISETASGGEIARLVLALKVVLQDVQSIPTLVFDEVDTGIGGAAAAAVGERLALLSSNTQVLVITHSPQVASRGETHLHVSKRPEGTTTLSSVGILSENQRIDEISRMLAGEVVTSEANAAARSLIKEAREFAAERRKQLGIRNEE
ncbi:MAG: AAA family ATPase [Alphaproteobacteria bacterium]|nr:AAA family ATPase [Alphaproteobacteria bacterium]MCL2504852.1 AAA family ATPase [Alphaproteobacteria bacterium]